MTYCLLCGLTSSTAKTGWGCPTVMCSWLGKMECWFHTQLKYDSNPLLKQNMAELTFNHCNTRRMWIQQTAVMKFPPRPLVDICSHHDDYADVATCDTPHTLGLVLGVLRNNLLWGNTLRAVNHWHIKRNIWSPSSIHLNEYTPSWQHRSQVVLSPVVSETWTSKRHWSGLQVLWIPIHANINGIN